MPSQGSSRRSLLIGACALLSTRAAWPSDDHLTKIAAARASLRTLRAAFTQQRTLGLLSTTVTSEGRLVLVRPDRLRWQLDSPDDVTYWVTPSGLFYASRTSRGSLPRESAGSIGTVLGDLIAVLGGDYRALAPRYRVTASPVDRGGVRIVAQPEDPSLGRRIRRVSLEVGNDLLSPREILLEESDEDRALIRFRDVQINADVDPALLRPS